VGDPDTVDMPARMAVSVEPGQAITLHFAVADGAGIVSVAMSPAQARHLAEQLVRAVSRLG
jgi:hypothetical protein